MLFRIVGTNNEDMALAANTLAESGGGMVAVRNGEVLALLALAVLPELRLTNRGLVDTVNFKFIDLLISEEIEG